MKTLVFANQKGGVGKSALAVQFAYYSALKANKKVLFIDLDHQSNATRAFEKGEIAHVSKISSSDIMKGKKLENETKDFVVLPADNTVLLGLEKQASEHNKYASNLSAFLDSVGGQFDLCIIDTNPNPDIRQLSALVVSDFVLSPLQLNQEAIDGVGDLLNHPNVGINKIRSAINPDIVLLGVLPNLVEPTKFQKDNFQVFIEQYSHLLIKLDEGFAMIKKSTAIAEAQAVGLPVWEIKKQVAKAVYLQLQTSFTQILKNMGEI